MKMCVRRYLDPEPHELDVRLYGRLGPAHQGALLEVVDQQLIQARVRVQVHQEVLVLLHLHNSCYHSST